MRKIMLVALAALMLLAVPVFAQDEPTIADIVVSAASGETPEFSTLLAAILAADPAVLEAASNPEAELTVFAPTDAAFAALAEALGEEAFGAVLADQAALSGILLYHVVAGNVGSTDLAAALAEAEALEVTTVNGATATIAVMDGSVMINDANIIITNVDAANGIIHVIDAVILPPG